MSKKSRKTPKQRERIKHRERIDRMEATFQMVDVMPLLGALSISLSTGDYKRGYNACESIVRLIYSVQLRCVCMERTYQ